MYLLERLDCLRGFTKIGKTITPTVKTQIGATTINIDSKDMNNFEFINKQQDFCLKSCVFISILWEQIQNFYKLLSKKEKKIKKNQFFHNSSYLINHYLDKRLVMDEEKKWMLMTYYCPTHGDSGLVKPIQLTKNEISKTFLKKDRSSKN